MSDLSIIRDAVANRNCEIAWGAYFLPSPEQITDAQARGKEVWFVTHNRRALRKLANGPLDGICSNYPLEIRKMQNGRS